MESPGLTFLRDNFGKVYSDKLKVYTEDPEMIQLVEVVLDSSDVRAFCYDICKLIIEGIDKNESNSTSVTV
jgi:hypothetical protein